MGIREELLRRGQIPADQVDDLIAEAGRLQEHDRALEEHRATREELDRVAGELDISPEYVERALQKREEERRAAEAAAVEAAERAKEAAKRRTLLLAGGAGAAAVLGVSLLGIGLLGASSVDAAATRAGQAEVALEAVLDRQASLAPQLVGLAGGDPGGLSALAAKVKEAEDMDERIGAADVLSVEMAKALGQLPPPQGDAEAQLRLNLQYEVTGAQNRVTVEARRWKEAHEAWERAASSGTGGLAVRLGLAEGPKN